MPRLCPSSSVLGTRASLHPCPDYPLEGFGGPCLFFLTFPQPPGTGAAGPWAAPPPVRLHRLCFSWLPSFSPSAGPSGMTRQGPQPVAVCRGAAPQKRLFLFCLPPTRPVGITFPPGSLGSFVPCLRAPSLSSLVVGTSAIPPPPVCWVLLGRCMSVRDFGTVRARSGHPLLPPACTHPVS